MIPHFRRVVALLMLPLLLNGCSKSESEQALDSNANGYVCRKCDMRFYTERAVFAEHCPKCKGAEISDVLAFVCPNDKQMMLLPRGPDAIPCGQCKTMVRDMKLPQEEELKSWGALKQPGEKVIAP